MAIREENVLLAEIGPEISEISLKRIRFGGFAFDLADEELWRGDERIPLRPRASLVLGLLISRAGRIVSRDDLRAAIWGETIVEWQDGLHQIVRELRKALGDDSRTPSYIETVSRRGYRFCAEIEPDIARPQPRWRSPRVAARDLLFLSGGALGIPALVLLACVAIGVGT